MGFAPPCHAGRHGLWFAPARPPHPSATDKWRTGDLRREHPDMPSHHEDSDGPPVSTGIPALDDILRGGFTPSRLYLVEGNPGSGKTTLALQFLLDGVRRGESTLYVTLSETKRELVAVARSHGWSLDG